MKLHFDCDGLRKGDRISIEAIEAATGVSRRSTLYQIACLNMRSHVQRKMSERGLIVTIRQDQLGLEICDDATASAYNELEYKRGIRKMVRSHARLIAVDSSQLSDAERSRHERRLTVQGALLAAMSGMRKQLRIGGRLGPKRLAPPPDPQPEPQPADKPELRLADPPEQQREVS